MAWPVNKKVVSIHIFNLGLSFPGSACRTHWPLFIAHRCECECADGCSLLKESQDRGIGCVLLFDLMAMDLLELLHTWPLKCG